MNLDLKVKQTSVLQNQDAEPCHYQDRLGQSLYT
jgi:hypothetical protein